MSQPYRPYSAESLQADLKAQVRGLYRLREDAQRQGVWMDIEAACLKLNDAARTLKRKQHDDKGSG